MQAHSTFNFSCVCGRAITSLNRETSCPDCARQLFIDWSMPAKPKRTHAQVVEENMRLLLKKAQRDEKRQHIQRLRAKFFGSAA